MGTGEIAHYEQFLLFPQCFQKAFSKGRQNVSLCGNWLKVSSYFVFVVFFYLCIFQFDALLWKKGGFL